MIYKENSVRDLLEKAGYDKTTQDKVVKIMSSEGYDGDDFCAMYEWKKSTHILPPLWYSGKRLTPMYSVIEMLENAHLYEKKDVVSVLAKFRK